MGFLGGALRSGIALKAARIIRREAKKPENQRKAKDLFGRLTNRGSSSSGTTTRNRPKTTGGRGKAQGRKR